MDDVRFTDAELVSIISDFRQKHASLVRGDFDTREILIPLFAQQVLEYRENRRTLVNPAMAALQPFLDIAEKAIKAMGGVDGINLADLFPGLVPDAAPDATGTTEDVNTGKAAAPATA